MKKLFYYFPLFEMAKVGVASRESPFFITKYEMPYKGQQYELKNA